MKENTSYKRNDKTLLNHHFFTLELVRRKLIAGDNEFDLFLFDSLFEDFLRYYDFKTMIVAISYTISCIKRNKFKDEEDQDIECLYAYFKVALGSNLRKLTTPVHIDWMDDQD